MHRQCCIAWEYGVHGRLLWVSSKAGKEAHSSFEMNCQTPIHAEFHVRMYPIYKSSRSSSLSSHAPFRRLMTIFSSSLFSATAPRSSFSWSSVTFWRSCPVLASVMRRFSTSVALDSLTSRIRPRRSAASGRRIWERMVCRASAGRD